MEKTAKKRTRGAKVKSASLARRERHRADLRAQILTVAGELFVERGYEEFSLRQVAERIGYSATTIYLHFANKDELILAAAQDGFANFDRHMATVSARHADPLQRIAALGRAYIDFGIANASLYRLMFMQRREQFVLPRLDDDFAGETDEPQPAAPRVLARALLVEAVRDGMAKRQLKNGDAVLIADVLWVGVHGIVALALSPLITPEHVQKVIPSLLQTLIEGINIDP